MRIQIYISALTVVLVAGLFLTASGASAPPPKQGTSAPPATQVPQYILDKIARTKASQAAQSSVQLTRQNPQPATPQKPSNGGTSRQSLAPPRLSNPVSATSAASASANQADTVSARSSTPAKGSIDSPVSSSVTFSGIANTSGPIVLHPSVSPEASSAPENQWKVSAPFEVAFVDGFLGVYQAGEPIVFYVEGRSPVQIEALPENGFSLSATIYDASRSRAIQSVAGDFDEARHAWQVSFTAPGENTISYEVEIYLYCGRDGSKCAEIYGRATQSRKLLSLNVN